MTLRDGPLLLEAPGRHLLLGAAQRLRPEPCAVAAVASGGGPGPDGQEVPYMVEGLVHPPVLSSQSALSIVEYAVQHSQVSTIAFDPEGNCTWANAATLRLFGLPEGVTVAGRLSLRRHCTVPGDPARASLETAFQGEAVQLSSVRYDLRHLSANGPGNPTVVAAATLLPLLDDQGRLVALYAFNQPCGGKELPPGPSTANGDGAPESLLHHSIATAKRFARQVSHDFNNIVAVMQGYAGVLQNRLQSDPQNRKLAELIEQAGAEATRLTDYLAYFANSTPLDQTLLDLNAVVNEFLAQCIETKPAEIELQVDLGEHLPGLLGNAAQLQQICWVLWRNAVEAMPHGGQLRWQTRSLLVDPSAESSQTEGNTVPFLRLRVSDTGVGMDGETQASMFYPFFTTKVGKGRGLGLTLAYDIIRAYNGFVKVTSGPGAGTTMDLFLPAESSAPAQASPQPALAESREVRKLLVVDDEAMLRMMLQELLRNMGYEVVSAASGEEALALYQKSGNEIAAVILDITMPGMSGVETLRRLKGLSNQVKVIVTSGNPHDLAVREMMELGACNVLPKPFRPHQLTETINQVLR